MCTIAPQIFEQNQVRWFDMWVTFRKWAGFWVGLAWILQGFLSVSWAETAPVPAWIEAVTEEALRFSRSGENERALRLLEAACFRAPEVAKLHVLRGRVLQALGKETEALSVLGKEALPRLSSRSELSSDLALEVTLGRVRLGLPSDTWLVPARICLSASPGPRSKDPLLRMAVAIVLLRAASAAKDPKGQVLARSALKTSRWFWLVVAGFLFSPWFTLLPLFWIFPKRSQAIPVFLEWSALCLLFLQWRVAWAGCMAWWELPSSPVWEGSFGCVGLFLLIRALESRASPVDRSSFAMDRTDLKEGLQLGMGLLLWVAWIHLIRVSYHVAAGGAITDWTSGLSQGPRLSAYGVLLRIFLAPFLEESLFRKVLLTRWSRRGRPVAGLLFSSLAFALVHFRHPVELFGIGIFLGRDRQRHQKLGRVVLAHIVFNASGILFSWVLGGATFLEVG